MILVQTEEGDKYYADFCFDDGDAMRELIEIR